MAAPGNGKVRLMAKTDDLVDMFKGLTLSELSDFTKKFEQTFGVTAVAPVVTVVDVVEPEIVEEQTEFDVVLESAGDKKIGVIKAVREIKRELQLKEAKDLVDSAPQALLVSVNRGTADAARAKLEAAGATVTVR